MLDDAHRTALLVEIHRTIAEASAGALATVAHATLTYPPGVTLTDAERAALEAIGPLSPAGEDALRAVIADAMGSAFVRVLRVLDGSVAPSAWLDAWYGLELTPATPETEEEPSLAGSFEGTHELATSEES